MLLENYFTQLPNGANDINGLFSVASFQYESITIDSVPERASNYFMPPDKTFRETYRQFISPVLPLFQEITLQLLLTIKDYPPLSSDASIEYLVPSSTIDNYWMRINIRTLLDKHKNKHFIISLWKLIFPRLINAPTYPIIKRKGHPCRCPKFREKFREKINIEPLTGKLNPKQKLILALAHTYTKEEMRPYLQLSQRTMESYCKVINRQCKERINIDLTFLKEMSLFFTKLGLLEPISINENIAT